MATAEGLMTAEEFGLRPDPGYPEELVQGRIITMPPPDRRHDFTRLKAGGIIGNWLEHHEIGRAVINSGVVTEHDPDTVRGADIAYYSYAILPQGTLSKGYGPEVPELVIEVRSSSDRWRDVLIKVGEYLDAGVQVVVVLDPEPQVAHVFKADEAPRIVGADEELTFPGILEGFTVRVGRLFE